MPYCHEVLRFAPTVYSGGFDYEKAAERTSLSRTA